MTPSEVCIKGFSSVMCRRTTRVLKCSRTVQMISLCVPKSASALEMNFELLRVPGTVISCQGLDEKARLDSEQRNCTEGFTSGVRLQRLSLQTEVNFFFLTSRQDIHQILGKEKKKKKKTC